MLHSLSVVMPAFNEEEALEAEVRKVHGFLSSLNIEFEVIIVNDASLDGTHDIVEGLSRQLDGIVGIHHQENKGVGGALKTGLHRARHDWAFLHPSDGQFDIIELAGFIRESDDTDIVVGYKRQRHPAVHRRLLSYANNLLVQVLFGLRLKDLNWVTLYRMSLVNSLTLRMKSPIVCTELLVRSHKKKARICQVPTNVLPRAGGKPSAARLSQVIRSIVEIFQLRYYCWFD